MKDYIARVRERSRPTEQQQQQQGVSVSSEVLRDAEKNMEVMVRSSGNLKQAMVRSASALNELVQDETTKDVTRATRYTVYKITRESQSNVTRAFMLLVNLFITFKIVIMVALYSFFMATPVSAPAVPDAAPQMPVRFANTRELASTLVLVQEETTQSLHNVLSVLSQGVNENIWKQSDREILEFGRTRLCPVLAQESHISSEVEQLYTGSPSDFMGQLEHVCTDASLWGDSDLVSKFFQNAMIGARCVMYNPWGGEPFVVDPVCPNNGLVEAAVKTANKHTKANSELPYLSLIHI